MSSEGNPYIFLIKVLEDKNILFVSKLNILLSKTILIPSVMINNTKHMSVDNIAFLVLILLIELKIMTVEIAVNTIGNVVLTGSWLYIKLKKAMIKLDIKYNLILISFCEIAYPANIIINPSGISLRKKSIHDRLSIVYFLPHIVCR